MALIDFKVLPGIDKQDTTSGAENRWVDCDNTRFRYGLPEKVGGWSSLITDTIVSPIFFALICRKSYLWIHEKKLKTIISCKVLTLTIFQVKRLLSE